VRATPIAPDVGGRCPRLGLREPGADERGDEGLLRSVESSFEDPLAERLEAVLAGDRDLVDMAVYQFDGQRPIDVSSTRVASKRLEAPQDHGV
jgi:hypothetical protein